MMMMMSVPVVVDDSWPIRAIDVVPMASHGRSPRLRVRLAVTPRPCSCHPPSAPPSSPSPSVPAGLALTSCDVRATMNGSHGEMVLVLHGLLRHSEGASARG